MTSFKPSRIKYLVQESILHNKNVTEFVWKKHERKKHSNYKKNPYIVLLFSRHKSTVYQLIKLLNKETQSALYKEKVRTAL